MKTYICLSNRNNCIYNSNFTNEFIYNLKIGETIIIKKENIVKFEDNYYKYTEMFPLRNITNDPTLNIPTVISTNIQFLHDVHFRITDKEYIITGELIECNLIVNSIQ